MLERLHNVGNHSSVRHCTLMIQSFPIGIRKLSTAHWLICDLLHGSGFGGGSFGFDDPPPAWGDSGFNNNNNGFNNKASNVNTSASFGGGFGDSAPQFGESSVNTQRPASGFFDTPAPPAPAGGNPFGSQGGRALFLSSWDSCLKDMCGCNAISADV